MKISLESVQPRFLEYLEREDDFWIGDYVSYDKTQWLFFGNTPVANVRVKEYIEGKFPLDKEKWRKMYERHRNKYTLV